MRRALVGIGAVVCLALILAAAACGDDSDSSANGTTSGSGDDYTAAAQDLVDEAYTGTFRPPPASGPAAQKDKNVWVISCSQALPGCARPAMAIQEAGKTLGWKVNVFDGKYNVPSFTTGIRQALAADADAIITIAMDCPTIKQGLTAAKQKGVPTVGLYSYDCSHPAYGSGEQLFTAEMNYGQPNTEFFQQWGALHSDYAIAKTNGQAKAVIFTGPEFQTTKDEVDGMKAELAKCSGCEVVAEVPLPATSLATGQAAQTVSTTMQRNPDANVVMYSYDAQLFATAQALQRLNRPDLIVIGGEGYFLDLIRNGPETAGVTTNAEWMGYAGADTANRLIAGETEIPDSGWGFQIVDAENNLPASGIVVTPPVDYVAAYNEVWTAQ